MKYVCLIRQIATLIFSRNINVDFAKTIAPNIACLLWLKNGEIGGTLLTHLSKTLDFLKLNLLTAKLTDYGLDSESLNFISSCLSGRTHRTKINNAYSNYLKIIFGVTKSSVFGPLLLSFYTCDMFFEEHEFHIATCDTDDNTFYI